MTRCAPANLRARRAFTLVEAIATIAILSVLSTVSSRLILESAARYSDTTVRARLSERASAALDRMAYELRSLSKDSSTVVPSIASTFSATQVDFTGATGSATTIAYNAGSSTVTITVAGTSATLLTNCSAFSLTYADKDNATVSPGGNRDDIRRVVISFTLTESGISETLRTRVYIRAMMSGSGAS